jgi:hypothetical protein
MWVVNMLVITHIPATLGFKGFSLLLKSPSASTAEMQDSITRVTRIIITSRKDVYSQDMEKLVHLFQKKKKKKLNKK